ncbi:MAG: winged helix-turn-helix domain-containing protein [Paraburkholderia sp.]|nr:winged helix-turn-helix domain-containing protein [Paraburkholderia sp.]
MCTGAGLGPRVKQVSFDYPDQPNGDQFGHGSVQRPTSSWLPDFARLRGSPYRAIADQIEDAIRNGVLRPGERLPSQRAVADVLGFHLNTVNAAYREAARRGLVIGNSRRGTIVLPHQ